MKLITWNCNMAFRKKAEHIMKHRPDIMVIPECEHPDKFNFNRKRFQPADAIWFGHNPNKGLAVLSYGDYTLQLLDEHVDSIRIILPIAVTGPVSFTLFAIWANNPGDPDGAYVTQTWKALHKYASLITPNNTILAGDFNSNTIWDRPKRTGNHSHVVERLAEQDIHSCYHIHYKQEQGKEKHPTQFMYRHKDKPYHLDYCFASADIAAGLKSVQVGRHGHWSRWSDHMPVIVEFGAGSGF